MTRVALLGTGTMGSAVAARLDAAGCDLVLWNRTRGRAEALGIGAVAETPAAAARGADLVLTSLIDAAALRDVLTEAAPAADGQTFVDTGTVGVAVLEELAAVLRARGSELLDCPIAGTAPAVRQGGALLLLSGDHARAERATAILSAVGTVRCVGPLGTATRLKLASNCMVAATNLVASELVGAAVRLGIELDVLLDLLERQAPGLAVRREHFLDAGERPALFTLAGMTKDLELALAAFGDAPLPATRATRDAFARAADADPGADLSRVVRRA